MNHSAIELAIYTIQEEMEKCGAAQEQLDVFQEATWGLFGLTGNGMTPEMEEEIKKGSISDY